MLALGAVIGAGIFVAVGEAARVGGPAIVAALAIAALVAVLNAFGSVELGVTFPRAGGAYEFGRRLISPVVGFVAGWLLILAGVSASAAYALTFASYLNPLFPSLPLRLLSVAFALVATAVNYFGITLSIRVNNILVFIKVAALLLFAILAAFAFDARNFTPFFPRAGAGFLSASAILFFAYAGYGRPVTVAEEIYEPQKTLPRAVGLALGIAAPLYLLVTVTGIGAVGGAGLSATSAPLYFAAAGVSKFGAALIAVGALFAAMNVILTEVTGLSRVLFAMARSGDLPDWLYFIHAKYAVPTRATVVVGLAIILLSFYAGLSLLIESSSLFILVYYVINNISALRLSGRALYSPIIPAAGAVFSLILAASLSATALAVTAVAVIVALIYFGIRWGTFNPPRKQS